MSKHVRTQSPPKLKPITKTEVALAAGEQVSEGGPSVASDLQVLQTAISVLYDRVYILGDRLLPIRTVTPPHCTAPDGTEAKKTTARSPVSDRIHELIGVVQGIERATDSILSSLDI
jgi:hypothetical protein